MNDKILIDRAVAEKALELLRESVKNPAQAPFNDLLAALVRVFSAVNDALNQQEQDPVAWMREGWGPDCGPYVEVYRNDEMGWRDRNGWTPLYTHPPRREWQGLTPQDISSMWGWAHAAAEHKATKPQDEFAQAFEAKLKEKNT